MASACAVATIDGRIPEFICILVKKLWIFLDSLTENGLIFDGFVLSLKSYIGIYPVLKSMIQFCKFVYKPNI